MSLPNRPTNNRYNNLKEEKNETQRLEAINTTQKSNTVSPKKTLTQDFVIEEDWQTTEFPEIKDDSARDRPPSAPVLKTPKKSRPVSAAVKKTSSRPSSASNVTARKQQQQQQAPKTPVSAVDDSGSSRKKIMEAYYLDNVDKKLKKRKIPNSFHKDPEAMYMEIQELKQKVSELSTVNTHLKTNLQKTEYKSTRKQKQVEELLKAHAIVETKGSKYENLFKEVNLVKRLKQRIRDLEKALAEKEETFNKIKMDSRYTRVRELETELKAYYTESVRLQKLVEQLQQFPGQRIQMENEPNSNNNNNNENQGLKEKIIKYRDLLRKMKQIQDHLRSQNEQLTKKLENPNYSSEAIQPDKNQIEGVIDEAKDLEIKELKQELENMSAENERLLSTKEKQNKIISDLEEEIRKKDLLVNNIKGDLLRAKSGNQMGSEDSQKAAMTEEIKQLKQKIQQLENKGTNYEEKMEEIADEQTVQAAPSFVAAQPMQQEKVASEQDFDEQAPPRDDAAEDDNPFAAEEETNKKKLNFSMNSMSMEEGETFDVHQNEEANKQTNNNSNKEEEENFQPDDLEEEPQEDIEEEGDQEEIEPVTETMTEEKGEDEEIDDGDLDAAEEDLQKSEEW